MRFLGKRVLTLLAAVALACAAQGALPATLPARLPVPERAAISVAGRQVTELVTRRAEHDAASLLKLAAETTSSPALKYAATTRAIEQAASAGNASLTLKGLNQLADSFEVDIYQHRVEALQRLARSDAASAVITLAMRWTDDCYVQKRIDIATGMMELVRANQSAASGPLASAVSEYLTDCQFAHTLMHRGTTRPASNLFECLYQNAWPENLAPLAAGGDEFAGIARDDLSATDKASRLKAADEWWSRGSERGGLTGWRIARRAAAIYAQLLPDTTGVEHELLAGRLAEHAGHALRFQGYMPGVLREVSRGGSRDRTQSVARDLQLPKDDTSADLPRIDAHVIYRGVILIGVPGPHQFTFTGGSSLRIMIDGNQLIDNPNASRKRNGEKCMLDLSAGLHPIMIEVASSSSRPRLSVEWITPGEAEKCPIPASVLFHDPLTTMRSR